MGLLDLTQVKQLQSYMAQPAIGARLFVYLKGSDTLSPIFSDPDLTEMRANPLHADDRGEFPVAYVLGGEYRIQIRSNQRTVLRDIDSVPVSNELPRFGSSLSLYQNTTLSYSDENGATKAIPEDIISVSDGGFTYRVADPLAASPHVITQGGLKLYVAGRHQFTPEAFGAVGDGITNDTAAWNQMLIAAVGATESGPIRIFARGRYLVDELHKISQFDDSGPVPKQKDSIVFDMSGAQLRHSGTGNGILPLEGSAATRFRYEISGGIWSAHQNTKWLIRGRDVRGSSFSPEALIGPSPCYGILLENWRSWSENNHFGGARTLEGRQIGHILGFYGRKEAWAKELNLRLLDTDPNNYAGELTGDPANPSDGDYYFNIPAHSVRRYDGTGWFNVIEIDGVQSGVSGKSFARTKIRNIMIASAYDFEKEGKVIQVEGASLYDSEIDGIRGNVINDGGSLLYWNSNFAMNTTIRNIGCEKANVEENAVAYVFRAGPNFYTATEAPDLDNINWAGGYAEPVDPNAGVVFSGQYRDKFIETTADTPATIYKAAQLHNNTTVEMVVKTNSNLVMGRALVGRKNSSSSLRIEDMLAQRTTAGPWTMGPIAPSTGITELEGERWIAPGNGWITAITLISDTPRTAGACTAAVRHNAGLAGSTGASVGLSASLNSSNGSRTVRRQSAGLDGFKAGDEIYAIVTANSTWAPETATVRVIIEVQIDGDVSWQDVSGDLTVTTATNEALRVLTKVWRT
ncbi:MAG: hypothetical protein AB8B71_06890 [Paracoccaceae bacterium]